MKKDDAESVSFNDCQFFIDQKFYYAGSCARWFFEYKLTMFPKIVDEFIDQVLSYESFYKKDCGPATSVAVYHLRSSFRAGEKRGIVCEYAAVRVFFKVQLAQVRQFLSRPEVKSFEGWVGKLEFLVNLCTAAECDD